MKGMGEFQHCPPCNNAKLSEVENWQPDNLTRIPFSTLCSVST